MEFIIIKINPCHDLIKNLSRNESVRRSLPVYTSPTEPLIVFVSNG